ncbi:MAG: DUF692 domain-containing protein [Gammaproteobacteria bacterium]
MKKFIGYGLGLRTVHYQHVLEHKPDVDWFEVHSENFMVAGGKPKYNLHAIREHYPLVLHGVSMSIGSTDPLDFYYLKKLKTLVAEVQPEWISDHFCWTSVGDINSHDLLPMPYNEEAIQHLVDRINQVQDFMGRQILFENVSSYLTYKNSEMEEWEFISEIVKRSDCKILLDINNIYVSSRNHGFSPHEFMNHIDPKCVQQFHLAGHEDCGDYVIDTHDHNVPDPVWELYADALKRFGPISTMIERDDNIPEFSELQAEMNHAKEIANTVHPQAA